MAYDVKLEKRIDQVISSWDVEVVKKMMFGGLGYLIGGNMAFGIHHNGELIVRIDDMKGKELLKQPEFHYFEMGGKKSMKNWYMAGGLALENDNLSRLLTLGRDFVLNLPPKK